MVGYQNVERMKEEKLRGASYATMSLLCTEFALRLLDLEIAGLHG